MTHRTNTLLLIGLGSLILTASAQAQPKPNRKQPKLRSEMKELSNGYPVLHVFDERDRLVGIYNKRYQRFFAYDERSLLIYHKNCDGRITLFRYDANRRLIGRTTPAGKVAYQRDGKGRLRKLTTPGGRVWSFEYDGERVSVEDGATGRIRHDYDAQGRTKRVRDASGRVQLFARGKDERGSWVDLSNGSGRTIQQRFDAAGKLVLVKTDDHAIRFARPAEGRLTITTPQAALKLARTADGGVRLVTPWGAFRRVRGAAGRTVQVVAPGQQVYGFQLDDRGRRVGIRYPNGTVATFKRDFMRRLVGVTHPAFRYEAEYDARHEQSRRVEHGVETKIVHDHVGRIETLVQGGKVARRFGYDRDGNRVLDVDAQGHERKASFDARFRIQTYGDDTFEHDAAGRLTKRVHAGGTDTFRYDGFGRLVEVARAGRPVVRYGYDGQQRIVRRTVGKHTTHFVWEGSKLLAEVGPGKRVRLYVDGDDMSAPLAYVEDGKVTTLHADDRGTVLAYSDATGKQVAKARYGVFGELRQVPSDRPLFYGSHWVDPVAGVIPMRARVYEPTLGRFLTPDPSGLDGGLNPYVYAKNDPVDYVDPRGLEAKPTDQLLIRKGAELEEADKAQLMDETLARNAATQRAKKGTRLQKGLAPFYGKPSALQRLHAFKRGLSDPETLGDAGAAAENLKKLVELAPIDAELKTALGKGLGGIKTVSDVKDAAENLRKVFFPNDEERGDRANPFKRFAALLGVLKNVSDKLPVVGKYLGMQVDAVEAMSKSIDAIAKRAELTEAAIQSVRKRNDELDGPFKQLEERRDWLQLPDPEEIVKDYANERLEMVARTTLAAGKPLRLKNREIREAQALVKKNLALLAKAAPDRLRDYAAQAKKYLELARRGRDRLEAAYARKRRARQEVEAVYRELSEDGSLLLRKEGYDFEKRRKDARLAPDQPNALERGPKQLDVDALVASLSKDNGAGTKPASWQGETGSRGILGAMNKVGRDR